jgi:2-iminobutanoate/2-iminopropanoate deaminase
MKTSQQKTIIRTDRAPAPFRGAPYSQAIRLGDLIFVSGQLPIDPATGQVKGQSIQDQTERVFANLRAILEEAGSGLDRLVKTTVFLTSLSDFAGMNEVYARHVGDAPPARSTIGVAGLPAGALIEVEAIAHL